MEELKDEHNDEWENMKEAVKNRCGMAKRLISLILDGSAGDEKEEEWESSQMFKLKKGVCCVPCRLWCARRQSCKREGYF